MTVSHTPAPWTIDADDMLDDPDTLFSVGIWGNEKPDQKRELVAHVCSFSINSEIRNGVEYITPGKAEQAALEETKANARLIAAAPDLLDALGDLLERYTSLANSGDAGNWDCEQEHEVIVARAAIAKATGEPA